MGDGERRLVAVLEIGETDHHRLARRDREQEVRDVVREPELLGCGGQRRAAAAGLPPAQAKQEGRVRRPDLLIGERLGLQRDAGDRTEWNPGFAPRCAFDDRQAGERRPLAEGAQKARLPAPGLARHEHDGARVRVERRIEHLREGALERGQLGLALEELVEPEPALAHRRLIEDRRPRLTAEKHELIADGGRAGGTLLGLCGQEVEHQRFEDGRDSGPVARGRIGSRGGFQAQDGRGVLAQEGRPAGERMVENAAERIEIRALVGLGPVDHLGGDVVRGPGGAPAPAATWHLLRPGQSPRA